MASEERSFQIQLEGLIQLLAQNIYVDPDVFLREMIQNAHDSIKRRAELARERGEAEVPAPRIQVVVNRAARTIEIHDNGSGLTQVEIDDYLSTIGRSGTDELRQRIREADRGRAVDLIGQFGIGLLSAFIVADTRCLDRDRLLMIVRTYADFIGVSVYLDDDADPANAVTAPWPSPIGDGRTSSRQACTRQAGQERAPLVGVLVEPTCTRARSRSSVRLVGSST